VLSDRDPNGLRHGRARAPRLLAADPALLAVLTSPLAGEVVRDLPLAPEMQAPAHTQAGWCAVRGREPDYHEREPVG
jgi:hypothetical protein